MNENPSQHCSGGIRRSYIKHSLLEAILRDLDHGRLPQASVFSPIKYRYKYLLSNVLLCEQIKKVEVKSINTVPGKVASHVFAASIIVLSFPYKVWVKCSPDGGTQVHKDL